MGERGGMRRDVKPELNLPPDFVEFWDMTRSELDAVDPAVAVLDTAQHDGVSVSHLEFASLGGVRVRGYLLRHDEPRPMIVHSHGYGSQCEIRWDWATRGVNVLGVDIRGFGMSADSIQERSRSGYVLTGIQSPETSILRGAVCDYARAIQVARSLSAESTTRLVAHGISFAGGLALMAETLLKVLDVLVVGVPTFGWADGRHFYVKAGSGAEISAYIERRPQVAEDIALVLRYFDSMSHAPDVTCPTLVGLGREDDVVPAKTVYPIANHLAGPHEIMEFPISHSDDPDEQLWQAFDDRCVALARSGVPDDFGVRRVQEY